jgi:hypothetical protein
MPISPLTLIVDSGVWYSLWDRTDSKYSETGEMEDLIESHTLVVPWPILYETVNTRFVKNRIGLESFEKLLNRRETSIVSDQEYREAALEILFSPLASQKRHLSLCDLVIRLMIEDINVRIDALVTFNHRDFADVCLRRRVTML